MDIKVTLFLLRHILCQPIIRTFLEKTAENTSPQIDDIAVKAIYTLLCPEDDL